MWKRTRRSYSQKQFEKDLRKAIQASKEEMKEKQLEDEKLKEEKPANQEESQVSENDISTNSIEPKFHEEPQQNLNSTPQSDVTSEFNESNETPIHSDSEKNDFLNESSAESEIKIANHSYDLETSLYRRKFDLNDPFKPPYFLNSIEKVLDESNQSNEDDQNNSSSDETESLDKEPISTFQSNIENQIQNTDSKEPPMHNLFQFYFQTTEADNEISANQSHNESSQITEAKFFEDEDYNDVEVDEQNDTIQIDQEDLPIEANQQLNFTKPVELVEVLHDNSEESKQKEKEKKNKSQIEKFITNSEKRQGFKAAFQYLNEFEIKKQKQKQNIKDNDTNEIDAFLKANKIPHNIFNSDNEISDEYKDTNENENGINMMMDMDMIIDAENKDDNEEYQKEKEENNAFEFEFEYDHSIDHRGSNEPNDNIFADKNILLNGQNLIKPQNMKNIYFPSNPYEIQLAPYLQSKEAQDNQQMGGETIIRANKRGRPGRKKNIDKTAAVQRKFLKNSNIPKEKKNFNFRIGTIGKPKQTKLNIAEFESIPFVPLTGEDMYRLMMDSIVYDKSKIV